ncbi:MAG: DinB family protein [Spirochaetaceae bacterium]|jgi:uncharacterized damage-inducible protein DinB|nr:DinB family protein [Spirochaetaceae bacterium]
MQKETLTLLARYNRGVNTEMDGLINTLTPEEWEKNLGGFFPSVRALCSHLYVCDFNWLKRFSALRPFAALKAPCFQREPYSFTEVLFRDKADYLAKRPELDGHIAAFIAEVTPEDLKSPLRYTDSSGKVYEKNFGGLALQSFNHDTHHRGMISLYLELLGKPNDFSSLGKVL